MIAFDNGPADGDYVRYIDDLMKRAAVAASAGVLSAPNAQRPSGGQAATVATPWGPLGRDGLRPAMPDRVPGATGFAAPTTASSAATAATAIASALMSGQMSGTRAWSTRTTAGLVALALGLVLVAVGFLAQPLSVLVIAGGGALVAWSIRWLLDTAKRRPASHVPSRTA